MSSRSMAANTIAIQVENHLTPTRVPSGNLGRSVFGVVGGFPSTTFDFYPFAGLHRPVVLYSRAARRISTISRS